jgi:hypothetical protein
MYGASRLSACAAPLELSRVFLPEPGTKRALRRKARIAARDSDRPHGVLLLQSEPRGLGVEGAEHGLQDAERIAGATAIRREGA